MAWYRPKKQTTDNLLKISIKNLRTSELLQDNAIKVGSIYWDGTNPETAKSSINFKLNTTTSNKYLEIGYMCNDDTMKYPTPLEMTRPNYGGVRWWFRCPRCGKRCSALYIKSKYFWCRKCNNLTYRSQQYSFADRMRLMSNKYERLAETDGRKTKGMHWSTYNRLMDKAVEYDNLSTLPMVKWVMRMGMLPKIDV